jgi:uncharacterized protein (DUF58 family)
MSQSSPLAEREKIRLRLPIEGQVWLLVTIILLATGIFKGINLVTLLACVMIATWGTNAWGARTRLRNLRAARWIEGPAFAASPLVVHWQLEQTGKKPAFAIRLEDRPPKEEWSCFVPKARPGQTVRGRRTINVPRRGRWQWPGLQLSSAFPFGLVRGCLQATPNESLIVLPRLGRLQPARLRAFLGQEAAALGRSRLRPVRLPVAQSEVHGVRPFRSGDSHRWIHWRTTARRGELMVREFEETPMNNLILVLDPWVSAPGDNNSARALEDAVSLAATVCWEWCRQRGDYLVLAVADESPLILSGTTGRDHAVRLLECLAVQTGCPAPDMAGVVDRLSRTALPAAPVLVVSTRPAHRAESLAEPLRRPVAAIDVSDRKSYDFYQRPADAP